MLLVLMLFIFVNGDLKCLYDVVIFYVVVVEDVVVVGLEVVYLEIVEETVDVFHNLVVVVRRIF